MALLDESIVTGQLAHISDHEQGHAKLNGLAYDVSADYGATGNGVTDDTSAVQAAIAAAAATGGTVFFPPGTYLISSTLTLYSNVRYAGGDVGSTTIKVKNSSNITLFKTNGFDALTGTASSAGATRFVITNLTLDGNSANNASAGSGIKIFGYDFCLSHLRIKRFRQNGIYSEWHTNAVPSDDFSMEASLSDVTISYCGDEGVTWVGPHDSYWDSVTVVRCNQNGVTGRGIWVKTAGNSLVASKCHVWGGEHQWAWYLEGTAALVECQGEGATTGQLLLGVGDCRVLGGHYFGAGAASTKGVVIGDAAHSSITGSFVQTKISNCTAGGIDYTFSGGTEFVNVLIYQTTGSGRVGTPATSSCSIVNIIGGATGAITDIPTGTGIRVNDSSAFFVGVTTRFNIDTNNNLIQLVNGSDLVVYSDAFSTQKYRVAGATGNVTKLGGATVTEAAGAGSPESVVTAPIGSTYRRTDGGAGTSFYVKESGAGNTGWVAK